MDSRGLVVGLVGVVAGGISLVFGSHRGGGFWARSPFPRLCEVESG